MRSRRPRSVLDHQPSTPPPARQATGRRPPLATPPQPIVAVRVPRNWREVFSAIRGSRWAEAQRRNRIAPAGHPHPSWRRRSSTRQRAHRSFARPDPGPACRGSGPAAGKQLARLALTRGTTIAPQYIARRPTTWLGNSPSRYKAKAVSGEPAADQLRSQLDPLVKADDPTNAELLVMQTAPYLSLRSAGRSRAARRLGLFRVGRDADARRVADTYRAGANGEWANQSAWVSGLASWRLNDCNAASNSFREVGSRAQQRELASAGYYWAARAEQACRRPRSVAPLLKAAAGSPESFYGLLARETLGMDKGSRPTSTTASAESSRSPTSAARKSWSASASHGSPRKCSSTRRRSAASRITMR